MAQMQSDCDRLAGVLETVAYDGDWDELADFFEGVPGIGWRENDRGEYQSAHVLLTFGPTIELDTATGEVYGYFYFDGGTATISSHALKNINEFFCTIHDC